MATLNQPTAQRLAEETAAAGYENLHSFWVSCRVWSHPHATRKGVRPLPCAAGREGRRVQLLCSIAHQNILQHSFRPHQHVVVPVTQHQVTMRLQHVGTPRIVGGMFNVLPAIQFDHHSRAGQAKSAM